MISKILLAFMAASATAFAEETQIAPDQKASATLKAGAPAAASKVFKIKTEMRSSQNSFSDRSAQSQFRLRLDPTWNLGAWSVGARQDIKNKNFKGQDDYTLENTRVFGGRNYEVAGMNVQARIEGWLPTNVKDRTSLTFQGGPGTAVKVKKRWLAVTSNYELNARKMNYQSAKANYANWIVFNELKNEIKITKPISANLNIKLEDAWDQTGIRSQKYGIEESLAYNVSDSLSLEIGHLIEKPLLTANKTDSFVGFDKDFSQLYTQINYVY